MNIENLVGKTLGQYELRELLGLGGMGAVYRAYQRSLRREVAVKVLTFSLAQQSGYLERFNREAETAASLEHAHIIPVYDYGTQDGVSFVAMRLLTGGTLTERIVQRESDHLPSLNETADLLKQLASALDYAHSQGVIHRDIKPSNIMFDHQGHSYLVDFGIAKLTEATTALTSSGVAMGTPIYMSPEQWRSEDITPAVDQYALGVTVYTLITGRVPFESSTPFGLMHKHLNETPTPPHLVKNSLPESLSPVLERALSKQASDRFPTVTAFAQAFTRAIQGKTEEQTGFFTSPVVRKLAVAPTVPPTPPIGDELLTIVSGPQTKVAEQQPARSFPFWILAAAGIGLVALLAFLLLRPSDDDQKTTSDHRETNIAHTQVAFGATQTAFITTRTPASVGLLPTDDAPEPTATSTNTPPPTETFTNTPEPTATYTDTPEPTATYTGTPEPTTTFTETPPPTETFTNTPEPTATYTDTPEPTATSTTTPEPTLTETPEPAATFTTTPPPVELPPQLAVLPPMTGENAGQMVLLAELASSYPQMNPGSGGARIFSPDGSLLAGNQCLEYNANYACVRDGIELWDVATHTSQGVIGITDLINVGFVDNLTFSPDGQTIILLRRGSVQLWDIDTGWGHTVLQTPVDPLVVLSPDGSLVAFNNGDNTIRLWETASAVERLTLTLDPSEISSNRFGLFFTSDSSTLVTYAPRDNATVLRFWNVATGDSRLLVLSDSGAPGTVFVNRDQSKIVFGGWNGELSVWNAVTGQNLKRFEIRYESGEVYTGQVWLSSWSPDESLVSMTMEDFTGRVINLETGETEVIFENGTGSFSPDSRLLLVNGSELWGVAACTVSVTDPINLRLGPGTEYDRQGVIEEGQKTGVFGQAVGSDGVVWWKLWGDQWVRSDLVSVGGDCSLVPEVES
ncbi:MAG TPA: protein kinase [Aggregatilineaceae bacterium]|nr:protein kinase [Aggregatilineaceae bacterium]